MAWMEKLMMQVALVDQVTKPLAGINAQMDKVSKAGRQGWSSMAMGATTVAAGGLAIQSALGPAIEMDRALAEVASLDVQKEVLGVLGREALKLSIQYGESATEIVRTSYDIQSAIAGLEGNELPAFTRAFTTLAKATKADTAIGQLPDNQAGAVDRVQALAPRAQYRPTTISQAAAQVGLRGELDRLLVIGRCLTVTPYQHGVGQHQGNQYSLAAPNAVATLTAKLQDGADPLLPTGQLHAIAWLVTGNSETALADALAPLCAILPLPEWCAALRRLTANNDAMSKPTASKVPRWKADEPLVWDPLRSTRSLLGGEIAQLAILAERRAAKLAELEQALGQLADIRGQLWHWQAQGDAASLAAQLGRSSPPDHSHSMTVGTLLLSPSPLTFWQELT